MGKKPSKNYPYDCRIMSVPISLWGKPPSLLGNASIPKKQEKDHLKPEDEDVEEEIYRMEMVKIDPGFIDLPDYQTKKSTFIFGEDATETGGNEPETKSAASSQTPSEIDRSKMNPEESIVPKGGEDFDEFCLGSIINRRLYKLPCTHGLISTFKDGVKINVLRQLPEVFDKELTTENVLQIADSIDLLRIMGASNPMLDDIGRKAREGARLYGEGLELMSKGQDLLRSCASDISLLK